MKEKIISFLTAMYKTGKIILGAGQCKFIPSCSEYSNQAFKKYPFFKALKLTIKRLIHCHPFSEGGYDPLP